MSKSLHTGGQRVNGGPQRQTNQIWPDPIVHSLWWQVSTFNKHSKYININKETLPIKYIFNDPRNKETRPIMYERTESHLRRNCPVGSFPHVTHRPEQRDNYSSSVISTLSVPSGLSACDTQYALKYFGIHVYDWLRFLAFSIWCSLGSPKHRRWSNHSLPSLFDHRVTQVSLFDQTLIGAW